MPDDLARRGVADTTKLPGYLWRDDALLLWGAITEFAKKILAHHYSSDKAVQSDPELQAFAAELSEKGMKGHDFPAKIDTVTQLVEIVSAVMFAATAGHSSTHYSEFDHYGALRSFLASHPCSVSIPSQPRALYQPPPKQKGVLTMDNILTLLPSGDAAIASVGMSYELSRYSKNQIFLGSYPEPLFTDSAPVQSAPLPLRPIISPSPDSSPSSRTTSGPSRGRSTPATPPSRRLTCSSSPSASPRRSQAKTAVNLIDSIKTSVQKYCRSSSCGRYFDPVTAMPFLTATSARKHQRSSAMASSLPR